LTSKNYENFQKELNELNEQEFKLRVELDELSGKLPRVRKDLPEIASQDLSSSRRGSKVISSTPCRPGGIVAKGETAIGFESSGQFTELSAGAVAALFKSRRVIMRTLSWGMKCEFVPVGRQRANSGQ